MSSGPHPFTLRQLQYVIAVAEELSFRRAAERCGVSQPSLSAQLAQVEDALGVRLFERGQRGVLVTVAGRGVIERAKRLVVDADDLTLAAARVKDPLSGTIRIGVIPTISPYLLPAVTPTLRKRFPGLRIAWVEDKTDVVVGKLAAGHVEAGILALEAEIGDVAHEVIAIDPFVLVARPEHRLARKETPVTAAELAGEEGLMLLDDGHCFRAQALEACGPAHARESEFRATSLSTLVQMVAGGAGVTLIPAIAVESEAKRARLCVRPLGGRAAQRTIAMIWRRQSALEPTLHAITAAIRDSYPGPLDKKR